MIFSDALRAISAIERFVNMAHAMEVPQLTLIATAAVRSQIPDERSTMGGASGGSNALPQFGA